MLTLQNKTSIINLGDKVMKKKSIITIVYLIGLLIIFPNNTSAKTLQDLYTELHSLQTKYNNSKSQENLTQSEINNINAEVITINSTIKTTESDITAATAKIKDSEKQIEDKQEETAELLKFLQKSSGENIYLEYLFDADDITDFIYRFNIVSQLSEYNTSLMGELENLIKNLEANKVTLSEKQKQLEVQKASLASKLDTLRLNLNNTKVEGTTIAEDIRDLKKEISYYESLGCKKSSNLTSCVGTPSASGWRYPLSYGCVTSEYSGSAERGDAFGGSHYAIDLSCTGEGSPVYAAAAGTVARIVYKSRCGGNQVYIQHIVNGTPYTTQYMHLLDVTVSYGQAVTDNTIIGHMGGGSTSSAHGGYDNCTTGAHLHFGMSNGHYGSNYSLWVAHSFNPRRLFSFPASGGGYFYRK